VEHLKCASFGLTRQNLSSKGLPLDKHLSIL
jgi:hypothetical protein